MSTDGPKGCGYLASRNVAVTTIIGVDSPRPRYLGPGETGLHFPSFSELQISRDPRARSRLFPRGTTDCYRRHLTWSHKDKNVLTLHLVPYALGHSRKSEG